MNHTKPRFSRPWALVLCLLATASSAFAFPPAPTFTVHGIARDPFGWAIQSTDNATVVLKVNGVVVATSAVDERPRPGENFRLAVPMDTREIDPYRTGAQTTGNFFSLEVRFPNTTMPAATINSADNRVGRPGELLFVDFSVNPLFPTLRSGHRLIQRPQPQKQIPSSQTGEHVPLPAQQNQG